PDVLQLDLAHVEDGELADHRASPRRDSITGRTPSTWPPLRSARCRVLSGTGTRPSGPERGGSEGQVGERRERDELGGPGPCEEAILALAETERLDGARLGVDDPVVRHAVASVELALGAAVGQRGRGGEDLDGESRGAFDATLGHQARPRGVEVDQVRLDDARLV